MRDFNTVRRKLAIATWSDPSEPNIHGKLTVDATEALRYLAWVRETTGEHATITHFVGKAVALALASTPSLNGYLRFGRFVPHATTDITYLVVLEGGENLAKARLREVDRKSVADIARELRELAARLREGRDGDFAKSMKTVGLLPTWLLRPILWLTGFLASVLGLRLPSLGVEPFAFGSAVITSVGMFGLDEGYAPFSPFMRIPLLVLVGAVSDQPAAVDGALAIRPRLTITATIDHRFVDGFQGGTLAKTIRAVFENPWTLEGRDGPPAPTTPA